MLPVPKEAHGQPPRTLAAAAEIAVDPELQREFAKGELLGKADGGETLS
jgi:hypothetical protein